MDFWPACLLAALAGSTLVAVFAAISTVLVLGRLVVEYRQASSGKRALLRQAAQHAETGRRLAIYERETGLLAYWYVTLRGKEECDRAARYDRPLALLLLEPAQEPDGRIVQEQLAQWVRQQVRTVDITGYLGNGRFLVLMPETDGTGAWRVVVRLHGDLAGVEVSLACLPPDGLTFDELYGIASQRLGESAQQAA